MLKLKGRLLNMQTTPISEKDAIEIATEFLTTRGSHFVRETAVLKKQTGEGFFVYFLIPEALDPDCVVDPPDLRVFVSNDGSKSELVFQI